MQYDTLTKCAIRNKTLLETLSEEMRILYVALTRAKEKLIITGIKKDYEKQKEKLLQQIEHYQKQDDKINPILVKKYSKYMDWILLVYFYELPKIQSLVELKTYTKKDVLSFCQKIETENLDMIEILEKKEKDTKEIEKIAKELNITYLHELATKIPTKSSVTKIKQGEQQEKIEISFPVPKFTRKRGRNQINRSTERNFTTFMYAKIRTRKNV